MNTLSQHRAVRQTAIFTGKPEYPLKSHQTTSADHVLLDLKDTESRSKNKISEAFVWRLQDTRKMADPCYLVLLALLFTLVCPIHCLLLNKSNQAIL